MEPAGKKYLKVTGIILIVIAALGLLVSLIMLVSGGGMLVLLGTPEGMNGGVDLSGFDSTLGPFGTGAFVFIFGIIMLVSGVIDLIFGILAVRNCAKPEKAKTLKVIGIILIVLHAFNLVTGLLTKPDPVTIVTHIVMLLVAAAYFYGAKKNQEALLS